MLAYVILATPVCVLVFLGFSHFFATWNGQAVSVRPTVSDTPTVYQVLIVDTNGARHERDWAADAVQGLNLPVDPFALPPPTIPEDRPKTRKSRYQMYYEVERLVDGQPTWQQYPTTSPQALGIAVLLWLLGLAGRNMWVAGSPIHFERRERVKIQDDRNWGAPVVTQGRGGKKRPPDQGRSKKRRQRLR